MLYQKHRKGLKVFWYRNKWFFIISRFLVFFDCNEILFLGRILTRSFWPRKFKRKRDVAYIPLYHDLLRTISIAHLRVLVSDYSMLLSVRARLSTHALDCSCSMCLGSLDSDCFFSTISIYSGGRVRPDTAKLGWGMVLLVLDTPKSMISKRKVSLRVFFAYGFSGGCVLLVVLLSCCSWFMLYARRHLRPLDRAVWILFPSLCA